VASVGRSMDWEPAFAMTEAVVWEVTEWRGLHIEARVPGTGCRSIKLGELSWHSCRIQDRRSLRVKAKPAQYSPGIAKLLSDRPIINSKAYRINYKDSHSRGQISSHPQR
jgi:hypothetical protein